MLSFLFRSATSHCVSSIEIWLYRNLLLGLMQFLVNHYNEFTICCLSTFWRPNFFSRVVSAKTSIFTFFLEDKGYIIESCLYSKLGNANVCLITDATPYKWPVGHDIFYQFLLIVVKKTNVWSFLKQIRHSPLPTAFHSFYALLWHPNNG